jgi:hypothetical protein
MDSRSPSLELEGGGRDLRRLGDLNPRRARTLTALAIPSPAPDGRRHKPLTSAQVTIGKRGKTVPCPAGSLHGVPARVRPPQRSWPGWLLASFMAYGLLPPDPVSGGWVAHTLAFAPRASRYSDRDPGSSCGRRHHCRARRLVRPDVARTGGRPRRHADPRRQCEESRLEGTRGHRGRGDRRRGHCLRVAARRPVRRGWPDRIAAFVPRRASNVPAGGEDDH